jgi:hypothetical protein
VVQSSLDLAHLVIRFEECLVVEVVVVMGRDGIVVDPA